MLNKFRRGGIKKEESNRKRNPGKEFTLSTEGVQQGVCMTLALLINLRLVWSSICRVFYSRW